MENEKRLIDANALWSDIMMLPHNGDMISSEEVEQAIKDAPTVDAVEVVRCKDCTKCEMCYPEKQLDKEATQAWLCKKYKRWTKPDDFCSYGERKDNG